MRILMHNKIDEWRATQVNKIQERLRIERLKEDRVKWIREAKQRKYYRDEFKTVLARLDVLRKLRLQRMKNSYTKEDMEKTTLLLDSIKSQVTEKEEKDTSLMRKLAPEKPKKLNESKKEAKLITSNTVGVTAPAAGSSTPGTTSTLVVTSNNAIAPTASAPSGTIIVPEFVDIAPEVIEYFVKPNEDLNTLIAVRREWDSYLVPKGTGGTRIPQHYVQPSEPSSDLWSQYLAKN